MIGDFIILYNLVCLLYSIIKAIGIYEDEACEINCIDVILFPSILFSLLLVLIIKIASKEEDK